MGQSDACPSESGVSRVYLDFYNLREPPFSITPDPEFLFLSNTHRSVIDKVLYGIDNRMGFILLTGEVGTGKTTICRSILDKLDGNAELVYLINPSVSGRELISGILDDLGISYPSDSSKKDLITQLNRFLLSVAGNRAVVIIIDDAQTMPIDTLEELRLLSNLETDKKKLIQMVLVGQPELLDLINRPEIRQIRQRVAINCRLGYLDREEIASYITSRLLVAGDGGQPLFTGKAVDRIARASGGIPRLINKICDYALTAGYIDDDPFIKPKHIKKALRELGGLDFDKDIADPFRRYRVGYGWKGLTVFFASCLILVLMISFSGRLADFNFFERKMSYPLSADTEVQHTGVGQQTPIKVPEGLISEAIPEEAGQAPDSSKSAPLAQASPGPFPYILMLGSYRTPAPMIRAASLYRNNGIDAHWNSLGLQNNGLWYRVFKAGFRTAEEAKKYKDEKGLNDSIVIKAPWTVYVGRCSPAEDLGRIESTLKANQFDCYYEGCNNGESRLMIGAFKTQAEAETLAREVAGLNLATHVALR